jgi:hypothetical protein
MPAAASATTQAELHRKAMIVARPKLAYAHYLI